MCADSFIKCQIFCPDRTIRVFQACAQRLCITDVGVFDAGQARYVKPHIDLMLKLHKMLNNAGHARTEDD